VLLGAAAGRLRGLGIDLVAMSVNDVITCGARPLFFLDVITCGKLDPERIGELVEGIAEGCKYADCALLGGETAEHPDMMEPHEFDLAGFAVGGCERRELIGGARVVLGDAVIALPSSGPHSNGFSLIRRLLERSGVGLDDRPTELGGASVADALLEPTRIYARAVRMLTATLDVHAMAHITGGGLLGNLSRPLPKGLGVRIDLSSWERPAVFTWLASLGVEEEEMRRVFNLGLGYAAVIAKDDVDLALRTLERTGEKAWVAGEVIEGGGVTVA
jgi:phosphoribosylformylglycinamidine cyclo-ligase